VNVIPFASLAYPENGRLKNNNVSPTNFV